MGLLQGRPLVAVGAALGIGVLVAGCLFSTRREVEAGSKGAELVARRMGLVGDETLVRYVTEIGKRVAAQSPRQDLSYRFAVVDTPEPNAFALPGGYVYVSRGLLALANDEDELANVIGHEIGHVAKRHAARRQAGAIGAGVVMLPTAIAGGILGLVLGTPGELVSDAVNAPLQIAGIGGIAAYSRAQEREADEVGQRLAAQAGYDPVGLTHFMETLTRFEELSLEEGGEPKRRPGFFDTHPATPERVKKTGERAREISWTRTPGIAGERAGFLERLEGLTVGASPAEGVFREELFLHPDLDLAVRFPEDWERANGRRAVAAYAPEKEAQIFLELAGEGEDPVAAGTAALEKLGKQAKIHVLQSTELEIGGFPAYRAELVANRDRTPTPLALTWIAKQGMLFRFHGSAKNERWQDYEPLLRQASESFRGLTPQERGSFEEQKLTVARAEAEEGLAALGQRSQNRWSPEETAVANRLPADASLEAGQLVKVSVGVPYRPRAQ